MQTHEKSTRAFTTAAILAVVAVALTLLLALTYQQRFSQQMYTLSEAKLQAELAAQNAMVKLDRAHLPDDGGPRGVMSAQGTAQFGAGPEGQAALDRSRVTMDVDYKGPDPGSPASQLFGDVDKMDITKQVGNFKFNPTSSNPNLRVFGHRNYQGASLEAFPYVAFAPAGTVTVDSVNSWSNASEEDLDKLGVTATQAYSGLPAWVGASTLVEIKGDFPYGEIHTRSTSTNALKLSGKGRAVAYPGSFPYDAFATNLKTDLDSAFTSLQSNAVDKTGLIVGVLQFDSIFNLVTGKSKDIPNFLSMQQASEWIFFVLPSIKTKGLALDLQMHTPLMADGSAEFFQLAEKIGLTTYTATQPADPQTKDLQDLQNEVAFLEWKLSHEPKDANPYPANGNNGYPPQYIVDWFKTLGLTFTWATGKTSPADGSQNLGNVPAPGLNQGDFTNPNGTNSTGDWRTAGRPSITNGTNPADQTSLQANQEGWIAAHDTLKVKLDALTSEVATLDSQERTKQNGVNGLQAAYDKLVFEKAAQATIDAKKKERDDAQKALDDWRISTNIAGKRTQRDKLGSDLDKYEHEIDAEKNLADAKRKKMQDILNNYDAGNLKPSAPIEGPTRRLEMLLKKIKVPGPDVGPVLEFRKGMKFFSYYELLKKLWDAFKRVINAAIDTFPMVSIRVNLGFVSFTIKIPAIWKIPEWLINVGKTMVQQLLKLVMHKISIVHLGGSPIQPFPNPNSASGWDALPTTAKEFQITSWTVPTGRTCRLAKNGLGQTVNMVITGDLWVQRGATMVVDGDLTVQPNTQPTGYLMGIIPGAEVRRMLEPRGRIILEEGASLCVGGNLVAKEVVACGPVGKIHGVTSGVLCKGNVSIAHGTSGGMTMEEVARAIGEEQAAKNIKNMFQDFFPNFCKLTMYPVLPGDQMFCGPFHIRAAYFGRHPVIIRYILPFGPIYPTFEIGDAIAGNNVNNTIMAILTVPMTLHLNMTLGENLITRSDLWLAMFQGYDHIPVFPKVKPGKAVKDAAAGFRAFIATFTDIANITPNDLKDGVVNGFNKALKDFPKVGLPTMLVPVALSVLDPTGIAGVVVGKVLDELFGFEKLFTNGFKNSLTMSTVVFEGFLKPLANVYGGFMDATSSMLKADAGLIETPGVLIYAGGNMILGVDDKDTAAGFFVAGGDITSGCHYIVGSLVSVNGKIQAHDLLYYPQFTKVSLFTPYRFQNSSGNALGGSTISHIVDFWETVVGTNGFKYGDRLAPRAPILIPSKVTPIQTAGGWGKY